jgi:hypothetical protein
VEFLNLFTFSSIGFIHYSSFDPVISLGFFAQDSPCLILATEHGIRVIESCGTLEDT